MSEMTTVESTDLTSMVEALKRQVALPGQFATAYPKVTDEHLVAALADAFAETRLDGFFRAHQLDLQAGTVTPALTDAGQSLVIIYAGIQWVRSEVRNQGTSVRYKAGPVEYEKQQAATVLVELLKQLNARKQALLDAAKRGAQSTYVMDAVWGREAHIVGRFAPLELPYRGGAL